MSDKVTLDVELERVRGEAKAELERRQASERGRYYAPNARLEEFIKLIDHASARKEGITIFILRGGNSVGKTALVVNLANYLTDKISNPYFDKVPYLKNFKRPNRGRICTTANAAAKTYAQEIPKWFSRGKYKGLKKGRDFDSYFQNLRTGSEFDFLTFDQDPESGESITLDWGIVDEPMSQRHWSGFKSRLRFGGVIFFILTPLEGSGWYHDMFETPERMGKDVFVMEASTESNCITHGIRGVIPHAALEDMWRDYDEAELPARRDGKYLHLAGAIYSTYRDEIGGHVLDKMPPYYQDCYNKKLFTLYHVVDPHDRKPFAIAWHAVFPNEKVITLAEWPDESWRPFHKTRSCNWDVPTYVRMIEATEKALGKRADVRLIDPNFGPSPKLNGDSVLQQFITAGMRGWRLPPDNISDGHVKVKQLLGDIRQGIEPSWLIMAHCKNMRYGVSHYGYKESRDESRGLSETPELVNKDFPDLIRYPANYGLRYLKREIAKPHEVHVPHRMGNGYVGGT